MNPMFRKTKRNVPTIEKDYETSMNWLVHPNRTGQRLTGAVKFKTKQGHPVTYIPKNIATRERRIKK